VPKPGRNDPCPCGSGKKFKKCCLESNVYGPGGNRPPPDIEQIKKKFDSYLRGEREYLEKGFKNAPIPPIPDEEDNTELTILRAFLLEWIIFDYRPLGEKTLFEKFLAAEGEKLPEEVAEWPDCYTTFFRVEGLDNKGVFLEKVFSEGSIFLEIHDPSEVLGEGDIVIFRPLPLGDSFNYFFALYPLPEDALGHFKFIMKDFYNENYPLEHQGKNWEEFFQEVPSFLLEVFSSLALEQELVGEEEEYEEEISEVEKTYPLPPPELRFAFELPVLEGKSLREVSFENGGKERIEQFLENFIEGAGIKKGGPEWKGIRELLALDVDNETPLSSKLEWAQPAQKKEAGLMENRFPENLYPLDLELALTLWKDICEIENPRIRKAGTWAASLEYLISMIAQLEVSQREMAEKYEVSEGTISRNIKRIADFFPKTKNDPFKEIPE